MSNPSVTGHAAPDLYELTKPTGTTIYQPQAAIRRLKPNRRRSSDQNTRHTPSGILVNADKAVVPTEELTEYALNPDHPRGADKARLFQAKLGMDAAQAPGLETQLREGIKTNPAISGAVDEHGVRFAVDVPVVGPQGAATVRSSWIFKSGSEDPSLTSVRVKIK